MRERNENEKRERKSEKTKAQEGVEEENTKGGGGGLILPVFLRAALHVCPSTRRNCENLAIPRDHPARLKDGEDGVDGVENIKEDDRKRVTEADRNRDALSVAYPSTIDIRSRIIT